MPHRPNTGARGQRAQDLAQILDMLARSPSARSELVSDVRTQVDGGTYLSEEKLNLAIYRLLKDILE